MKKDNNKRNKSRITRAISIVMAGAMAFCLASCGKKEEDVPQNERPEYVYVPEYMELAAEENVHIYNSQLVKDSLYFMENSYNEETMTAKTEIGKYSLTEGAREASIPINLEDGQNVNDYCVDKDENVYLILSKYPDSTTDESGFEKMPKADVFLVKYDAQGTQVYNQEITDILGEDTYINSITPDAQGRIYAVASDIVFLFDAEGNFKGKIDNNDNWINSIGIGKDGKAYISYYDATGMALAAVDFDAGKLGTACSGFPSGNGNGGLMAGIEKDFLVSDSTKVYEYDLASQSTEEVLTWLDSDINGQYVDTVGALEDGRLVALISDWGTGKSEIAVLTKTKSTEIAQKEQITIGTLYTNQMLQASAVAFNKSSDKYHINIKTYLDQNNWNENSYPDAIANLNNDITSGVNCPDILDLSQLNVTQLASKGVFEDLTPYLENSAILDKDDFMKNILDSFRYDGKLVSIPSSFSVNTVITKTADVGEEMGWTLEEMIAFADAHEGAALFDYATKGTLMMYCLHYNMDAFVDWSTGECKFDSPEFKSLLEFINRFPDEIDWEADQRSTPSKIAAGDVLLADAYLYDFNNIQEYMAMFNEPVTCIGYPTLDGSPGCMLQASELYAIASKSKQKEGAWAFIEHYLANWDSDAMFANGFPTRSSKFEERVEKLLNPEVILDENGEPLLDENGEVVVAAGVSSIGYGDWQYTYHTPTEEEINLLREVIAVAKPVANYNEEINKIITEEAEAFYKGQKSVDDVAKIIQSRAQLYVSENS